MTTIVKTCYQHGELHAGQVYARAYTRKGVTKHYLECRQCLKQRSRQYRVMHREAELERDRQYWAKHKAALTAKRTTAEAKAKRRNWYANSPEQQAKAVERAKIRNKADRDALADTYIRKLIQNGDKTIKWNTIPQELLDYKRTLIELKQAVKATQQRVNYIKLCEEIQHADKKHRAATRTLAECDNRSQPRRKRTR